jgi:hypothetical protein
VYQLPAFSTKTRARTSTCRALDSMLRARFNGWRKIAARLRHQTEIPGQSTQFPPHGKIYTAQLMAKLDAFRNATIPPTSPGLACAPE